MWLTKEKLTQRIEELLQFRYSDQQTFESLTIYEEKNEEDFAYPPENVEWTPAFLGDYWEGRDKYVWLSTSFTVPLHWSKKTIVGLFDFGKTGAGHNSGFESLLFVNGVPFQGVDSNHKEVFFPDVKPNEEVTLHFRLWTGLDGMTGKQEALSHQLKQAEMAVLHEVTDDLYYMSKAVIQAIDQIPDTQLEYSKLLSALNQAFYQIDWTNPGSETFYQSISCAANELHTTVKDLYHPHGVTIHGIGHTHIDVAWLWRLKHTREKSARSFSTVLRLMEKYPDYVFMQSQPQLYSYMKEDYPEIYEQIKKRVQEGRWEAGGAMWLESDCNIPSGESLTRQLLKGKQFFKHEFGIEEQPYLWLPDVFGYSWALPQILKKSGIKTFMTIKISWNQYNRMPHDTFYWRGIDGTEILTHFMTTPNPGTGNHDYRYNYNGVIDARAMDEAWNAYQNKSINQDLLMSYGYGDGGGGVNREMLEMRRRLDKVPGLPNIKPSRVDDYFNALHDTVDQSKEYIHTWDGELYLEYHRGTYTSQAHNKKMNRKLEIHYRNTEWLSVLSNLHTRQWDNESLRNLDDGWHIILRNQFHDIIPGSSIQEVYEDSAIEYNDAQELVNMSWQTLNHTIVKDKVDTFTIYNSSTFTQPHNVQILDHSNRDGTFYSIDGAKLTSQRIEDGWLVQTSTLPSLGTTMISFKEGTTQTKDENMFSHKKDGVTTPFYQIEWNSSGHLTRLYDIENHKEILDGHGNILQVFEDKPLNFDAWDIDIFHREKYYQIANLDEVRVIESGNLATIIKFKWTFNHSQIEQKLTLYANHRRIDFITHIDWHEQNQLLKVAFPVSIRSTEATFDIQYGNVKRPTHWNTSWDYARFETVGHQWADLSERGYGVSLLNDSKYGYDIKDNIMRLSLIKSSILPDPTQDQGNHTFTYSLLPHEGDWYDGQVTVAAWDLNNPLLAVAGESELSEQNLFIFNQHNVKVDAVKKAEESEGVILRFHEYSGQSNSLIIRSDFNIQSWTECDLMENPVGDVKKTASLTTNLKPYEIKTYHVIFQ